MINNPIINIFFKLQLFLKTQSVVCVFKKIKIYSSRIYDGKRSVLFSLKCHKNSYRKLAMLESFPEGMYLLFRTDLLIYVSGLLVDSVVFKIGDILEMGNN